MYYYLKPLIVLYIEDVSHILFLFMDIFTDFLWGQWDIYAPELPWGNDVWKQKQYRRLLRYFPVE